MLLFIYVFLLVGVLSIVRRGKMGTLGRGSIVSQIIGNYRAGIRGGKKAAFALAGFVLYVVLSFLLCRGGTVGAVILVFMNLYAGGHILREISAREQMLDGVRKISDEDFTYKIPTENLNRINAEIADNINRIGDNLEKAVQESVRNERRKTDLDRQCLPRLKDTPHIHHQLHRPSEAGGDTKSQDRGVCGCAGQEDRASEDPNGGPG